MTKGLQMLSKISKAGELELLLAEVDVPTPAKDQVVIRIEAAPINPSDMGPMFGPAAVTDGKAGTVGGHPAFIAPVPEKRLGMVRSRLDKTVPVGNAGAGPGIAGGGGGEVQAPGG